MDLIAETSTQVDTSLPVSVRQASLDARIIIDSFNEQVQKLMRMVEEEDNLEFAPSLVPVVKMDPSPKAKAEEKEEEKKNSDDENEDDGFDSRFHQEDGGEVKVDLKLEKRKTIALLKLASVKNDGSAADLSKEEINLL